METGRESYNAHARVAIVSSPMHPFVSVRRFTVDDTLALTDWRRRVAVMYAHVRAATEPDSAWLAWREERDRLFREHTQSPVRGRRTFSALPFFAYDEGLRFETELRPCEGADVCWPAGVDGEVVGAPFSQTVGLKARVGAELTLFWLRGYGGGVFLPFADETNGTSTYGGGRYLLDGIKGADLGMSNGRLIIDFNFAYNPSCAYSPDWLCPLAPAENRLPSAVSAGERTPTN